MNILVTGTSGLVGGYIYQEIKTAGLHNVIAVDREVIADLADSNAPTLLDNLGSVDVIVHCAAQIPSVGITMDNVAETNKKIDNNIFQFCKNNNVKIIFISSMSVYAQYGQDIIIDETMPVLTDSDVKNYFQEKANSELLLTELPGSVIFRVSSPYGKKQKNKNVLKIFMENARQDKDICYYGSGQRTQDFIHGIDIANAVSCALRSQAVGIFNIVSGEPITMERLAFLVAGFFPDYSGKVCSSNVDDPQKNFRANFSNEKAGEILGWRPAVSLSAGISELL